MSLFDIERPSYAYDPRKGIRFSEEERRSLTIAVIVLTFCFAVAFSSNGVFDLLARMSQKGFLSRFIITLVTSFIAVLTAFVLHEMGHKVVANHYGYPAAFSYSRNGLIFAAVISLLLGILFAAPGAVIIYGMPSKRENGIISLAGPLTNLIVAMVFGIIFVFTFFFSFTFGIGSILANIAFIVTTINIFIGAFNMIPIGILDGAKIIRWNKIAYFILLMFFLPGIIIIFII